MLTTVKIKETSRLLLNKAKAKFLQHNPAARKCSNDTIIRVALNRYLRG